MSVTVERGVRRLKALDEFLKPVARGRRSLNEGAAEVAASLDRKIAKQVWEKKK